MNAFLRARLARGQWLGLHLTVGVTVALACSALFAAIATQVLSHGGLTVLDMDLVQRMHLGASHWLVRATLAFTNMHSTPGVSVMVALLALYLWWRRDWLWLTSLALCVPGAMLLNVAVKHLVQRPRPRFDNPLVTLDSFSFPSGHVAAATAFYGLLAVLWMTHARSWPARLASVPVSLAMIGLVGWSRMALGAHYFSDVLAAFAQSTAWLALCLTGLTSWALRPRKLS